MSKIKDKGNEEEVIKDAMVLLFASNVWFGISCPCGPFFNEKYKKFHIGNICETRFKDIVFSDKYWEVMNYLSSPNFNAQKMWLVMHSTQSQ